MCEFFDVLRFAVILHDKVLETFRIGADRVEESPQLGQGIVIGDHIHHLLTFQVDIFAAGGSRLVKVCGYVVDEIEQARVHHHWGVGQRAFCLVDDFTVAVFA